MGRGRPEAMMLAVVSRLAMVRHPTPRLVTIYVCSGAGDGIRTHDIGNLGQTPAATLLTVAR